MRSFLSFIAFMAISTITVHAQESSANYQVGDVFVIGNLVNNDFNHIDLPKANFIYKKGGIPNYKNLSGQKVKIASLKQGKDGQWIARIQLVASKKFFNTHKELSVDLVEAVNDQELIAI